MSRNPFSHIDLRFRNLGEATEFYRELLPAIGFTQCWAEEKWRRVPLRGRSPRQMRKCMKNELKNPVRLGQPMWMIGGGQVSLDRRPAAPGRKKLPELRGLRLVDRAENDLASGIAYFVLAGSLFASLLEFFASLPPLP